MSKTSFYPSVDSNLDLPKLEQKVLKFWKESKTFEKSVESRQDAEFTFYDGPPFANGLPHYGHLLTGFIKDTYARYQTTKGKRVERRFGWDCHGLPAEMGAEKELGISGRGNIINFGIGKFNEYCKSSVMKYSSEWEKYVARQARWVDFQNDYKTMGTGYMESVLWAFKELYKKGYIYESMRVMPYSWACETPLSNFETQLDNSYRERADKSVTVKFKLKERPVFAPEGFANYYIAAWTTTPWTLPSNLALAVNAEMDYVCTRMGDDCVIMAEFAALSLREAHSATKQSQEDDQLHEIAASFSTPRNDTFKGALLANLEYTPLFPYFASHKNAFKILLGSFVEAGSGTGVVHMAPGFGEDDQILCAENNIELVCPVDNAGKFTKEVPDFEGLNVFDANDKVIIKLKELGNWIKTEQYLHNYPHCWRTDTPLIYKAVPSWYVKVTAFKDRMVELNKQINWIPGYVKDGLFGKWLENARDWSISRNRFFGTPIPLWRSDDPKYPRIDVYGSIEELERDFGVKVPDLHRPYIDELVRANPDDPTGKSMMRRVEDVFDCWFESGSMPYGQVHYPFENKDWFEKHFPADFIVEYAAQTRGWFYTLMVLSTALFDRPPFLNCICHGVILDSTGQKLSKRLNNYADPLELFEKYGADALRYTMLASSVTKGQELLIDKDGEMVKDALRLYIKPIWNAYNFFTLYANADGVKAVEDFSSTIPLDKYIILKMKSAIIGIDESLGNYDSWSAYNHLNDFFEALNNWYIRRSRGRFWEKAKNQDKIFAYNTLYSCLVNICKAMSSLLPLVSEEIYKGLTGEESVHLTNFPQFTIEEDGAPSLREVEDDEAISEFLENSLDCFVGPKRPPRNDLILSMDMVRDICSTALFVRNQENIRVRQPLSRIHVIAKNTQSLAEFVDLIKDEINVKEVVFSEEIGEHAEFVLSLNFPILGKRLPTKMKEILAASKSKAWNRKPNGEVEICGETLLPEEYSLNLKAKNQKKGMSNLPNNAGLIELDLEISEELYLEGIARDVIRMIQQARKDAGFDISDIVGLEIVSEGVVADAVRRFGGYIAEQTLTEMRVVNEVAHEAEAEIEGVVVRVRLG
jgi:isoleucyl-tRNA synthetase